MSRLDQLQVSQTKLSRHAENAAEHLGASLSQHNIEKRAMWRCLIELHLQARHTCIEVDKPFLYLTTNE